tara:strand:+ start:317 stop:706 length:390 start_codon:yes stop_codon:yes gene_type:complete
MRNIEERDKFLALQKRVAELHGPKSLIIRIEVERCDVDDNDVEDLFQEHGLVILEEHKKLLKLLEKKVSILNNGLIESGHATIIDGKGIISNNLWPNELKVLLDDALVFAMGIKTRFCIDEFGNEVLLH